MNNNANLPATSTLLQKLVALSSVQTSEHPSPMTERSRQLLTSCPPTVSTNPSGVSVKTTVFHSIYNTDSEFTLSQPNIDVAALSQLSPTENPSLIDFKQAYGERCAITWMLPHVAGLNAASTASNRMDVQAITLCCRDILLSFYWLTLAEFCVFCARMRSLQYARRRSDYVFGSDTIMMGLREFCNDLVTEKVRYEREHKPQESFSGSVTYEEARSMPGYQDIVDRITRQDALSSSRPTAAPPLTTRPSYSPSGDGGASPSSRPSYSPSGDGGAIPSRLSRHVLREALGMH